MSIIVSKMSVPRIHLKPYHLLVVAAVSGAIGVYGLRANYGHMVQLRDAVYQADASGDNVQQALGNLQAYVTRHMNTGLTTGNSSVYPPIQLVHTYDRLVQARGAALQKANSQLYTEAQHYCEQQNSVDFSGRNRVPCIEQYVQAHGEKVQPIADSLYKFDFVSPGWSPDLAGWSLAVAVISLLVGLGSLAYSRLRR